MNNEEKAMEIARNNELYGDTDNKSKVEECYIAALEMARWKDEQFKQFLKAFCDGYLLER
ncbi:MAG: hypothetical protein J6X18_09590 [Bacteroidales bacterium]|nr:hypothetical protein [Bacteroidales bacterium]